VTNEQWVASSERRVRRSRQCHKLEHHKICWHCNKKCHSGRWRCSCCRCARSKSKSRAWPGSSRFSDKRQTHKTNAA